MQLFRNGDLVTGRISKRARNAAGIGDVAMRGPDMVEILFPIDLATVQRVPAFLLR